MPSARVVVAMPTATARDSLGLIFMSSPLRSRNGDATPYRRAVPGDRFAHTQAWQFFESEGSACQRVHLWTSTPTVIAGRLIRYGTRSWSPRDGCYQASSTATLTPVPR